MSDKRRRRRKNSAGESEDEEEKPVLNSDVSDHEYASAAEDDDKNDVDESGSEADEGGEEQLFPKEDGEEEGVGEKAAEEAVGPEERGAGDGQESQSGKHEKVDVDEDRRNPAYIPKRGLFYEHDDRLETDEEDDGEEGDADADGSGAKEPKDASADKPAATGEGAAGEKAATAKPRRVLKSDAAEKWGHDKFMEMEQVPKSSEELVQVYGYDIRNEDNAPRARRRRRYGRGPNKYTRNWEDEEAYQPKPGRGGGAVGPQGGRRRSENEDDESAFPPLGSEKRGGLSTRGDRRQTDRRPPREERDPPQERGHREDKGERRPPREDRDQQHNRSVREDRDNHRGGPSGRGRGIGSAPFRRGGGDKDDRGGVQHQRQPQQGGRDKKLVDQAVEAKLDNVEREFSNKVNLNNKDRSSYQAGSGRVLHHDGGDVPSPVDGKPKRYSNSRPTRGGGGMGQRENRGVQQNYYEYPNQRNAGGRPSTRPVAGDSLQFGGQTFPNTHNSGPPPDAPFLSVTSASTVGPIPTQAAGSTPYINPATGGVLNYGPPPPVPYATVPVPLVHPNTEALAMIAATQHLNQVPAFVPSPAVAVSTQEQVLLAAAAASGQGYAEVRGGVTYFHPQATASIRATPVSKRPKAAIPIVDPSQVDPAKAGGHQNGEAKAAGSGEQQLAQPTGNGEAAAAAT